MYTCVYIKSGRKYINSSGGSCNRSGGSSKICIYIYIKKINYYK